MKSIGKRMLSLLAAVILLTVAGCAGSRPRPLVDKETLEDMTTTVPRLAGLPLKNAQTVLSFVALKVGEVTLRETDDPALHGQVCGQDPAAGTGVRGGTAVNVQVYRFVSPGAGGASTEEK